MLFLIGFSCSDGSEAGETEYKELEYSGYEFSEGKVSVFLKNYSNINYVVTLNSLSPEKEIVDKNLTELIFINSQNKNSSLKIKNIIETEEKVFSKALINPELNFKKVNINEEQIGPFLPYIYKKLNWLDREQLIQHFVSAEFNRYLSYYKNSIDINAEAYTKEKTKNRKKMRNRNKFYNPRKKHRKNRRHRKK